MEIWECTESTPFNVDQYIMLLIIIETKLCWGCYLFKKYYLVWLEKILNLIKIQVNHKFIPL